ncbi:MAG: NFACT RNA binding domain-containing protein [Candidatus Bipolaricaulota bacterium]
MDGLSIAASLVEVRHGIEGGLLRSVHEPIPGTFVFGVYAGQTRRLLLSPREARFHLTARSLDNPATPSAFVMQLRKHLVGGRVTALSQMPWERVVRLTIVRVEDGGRRTVDVVAELTGTRGNLLLLGDDVVLGALRRDPRQLPGKPYVGLEAQEKLAPTRVDSTTGVEVLSAVDPAHALVRRVAGLGLPTARDLFEREVRTAEELQRGLAALVAWTSQPEPHVVRSDRRATFYPVSGGEAHATFAAALDETLPVSELATDWNAEPHRVPIQQALAKRERTIRSLESWLHDADAADDIRRKADLAMLHAAEIGRGAVRLVAHDPARRAWAEVELDPALDGRENARRLYKRAKKLDRGRPGVMARLDRVRAEASRLRAALDGGADADVADLLPQARPARVAPAAGPRRVQIEGYTVLIGRSARENDAVLRGAAPHDIWLHALGVAGAHVLIRLGEHVEVPASVLGEAARLAARHSRADRRGKVAVTYTEARNVRKPKGGAPGLAIVTRGSTLTVDL